MENGVVYLLEAHSLTALTTLRAINRKYRCIGLYQVSCKNNPSLKSRFWEKLYSYTALNSDALDLLLSVGSTFWNTYKIKPVLLTATDDGVIFLSQYKDVLTKFFVIPMPNLPTVNKLMDKSVFYEWAHKEGLPIVNTVLCNDLDSVYKEASSFEVPFILKPKVRTVLWNKLFPANKIITILSEEDRNIFLSEKIKLLESMGGIIIQSLIPGGDENIYFVLTAYAMDGRQLASFSGQKLMQWPPQGGSTLACIKSEEPVLCELTNKIFGLLNMQGLASMEYKKCTHTGLFYIIEPTVGRCDHQSLIAEYCGSGLVNQLLDSIFEKSNNMPGKVQLKNRVWIDEIALLRLIRFDKYLSCSLFKAIGFLNILKIRFLLFNFIDLKPLLRSIKNIVKPSGN